MKHKLLSLMALVGAMFVSASAMAWDKPAEVTPSFDATKFVAPVDGGVYFLYNVGAEQFLGAGNDWGTHVVTSALSDDNPAHFWNEKVGLGSGSTYILPVILTKDGENWYIEHMGSSRTACYLSSEGEGNSWIDCGTDRRIDFIINAVDNGYTIQASNTVTAGTFFGTGATDDASVRNVMNNMTTTDNIVWKFCETNYAAFNAYDSKLALYNQLLIADSLGVSTAEAGAVYQKASATAEELKEATTKLEAANRTKEMENLFASASEESPMNVTSYVLKNADFNSGNVDGWDLGFTKGQGVQNLGYNGDSHEDKNGNKTVEKFIEAWYPTALADGYISQTVTGLPDGKYLLEVDVIGVNQENPAQTEGVYLFIKADDKEEKTSIQTGNGIAEHITTVLVIKQAEKVTFGLKTENTTANWIAADNFKVTYYGATTDTKEMIVLKEAIKAVALGADISIAHKDTIQAFSNLYDDALLLTENADADSAELVTMAANLQSAYDALVESAEEYKAVSAYVEAANALAEELKTILNDYEEIVSEILDLAADWQDGYEELTLTSADIAGMEGAAVAIFKEKATADNIKVGADLTFLLRNADFMEGEFGRDRTGDQVKGWTITGTLTELRKATENIENYHSVFSIKQTIANMPAGVYDITVQGFVRHDGTITNGTKFFAGNTITELISLTDDEQQASENKIFGEDGVSNENKGDGNKDRPFGSLAGQPDTSSDKWQCNGMTGAYYWFREENPNTGEPYYTNHVKAVLAKDGDLTIGLESTINQDWVIWGNFKIVYTGMDEAALALMLNEGISDLQALAQDEELFITRKGIDMIDDACDVATKARNADEMIAASAGLQTTKDYIIDGNRDGKAMLAKASGYLALAEKEQAAGTFDQRNTEDGSFVEAIATYEGYTTGRDVKDNEEIAAIVQKMYDLWIARVQKGSEVASKAAPFEVTAAILGHDFENSDDQPSYDGWTVVKGSLGAYAGTVEAYNIDSVDVNQTISGLKPGYYTIDMRGMYRPGFLDVAFKNYQKEQKQNYKAFMYGRTYYDETTEKFDSAWVHHIQTTLEGIQQGDKDKPFFEKDEAGQLGDNFVCTFDTTFCAKGDEGAFAVRYDSISADSVDGKLVIKYDTIYASKVDTTAYFYGPNSQAGFSYWVNDEKMLDAAGQPRGLYHNTIGVLVAEDGKLQLGFRKLGKLADDWLITADWRLYYYGQGAENCPDGIVLNERTLKSIGQQFYGIDGRRMATLRRGVNIVRETLSDGTTRTRKVLVK